MTDATQPSSQPAEDLERVPVEKLIEAGRWYAEQFRKADLERMDRIQERDAALARAELYRPFVETLSRMCFCGRGDGEDWHRSWTCTGCKARLALAADPRPAEAGGEPEPSN